MAQHSKSFKIALAEILELKSSDTKATVEVEFENRAVIFIDTDDCDVTVNKHGVVVE